MKAGWRYGGSLLIKYPLSAGMILKRQFGGFVVGVNGYLDEAKADSTNIVGWLEWNADKTSSATPGVDYGEVNISANAVYEIPVDDTTTLADTDRMTECDLIIVNPAKQCANPDASAIRILEIVDVDTKAGTVFVRLNPRIRALTAAS